MNKILLVCFIMICAISALAQDSPNPVDERKAYDALQNCSKEVDLNKKLAMAKEAIAAYPNSQYLPYFKQQILAARGGLFQQAMQQNKPEEAFAIGSEVIAEDPENLNFLLTLADYGARLAKAKNYNFAGKSTEYARKSVELINNGKIPTGINEEQWAKSKNNVLATLHQSLGLYAMNANKEDEAVASFNEALKHNCSDPYTYIQLSKIYNNRYQAAAEAYQKMSDEEKTSDAGKEALEKINSAADQLIETYAKVIAFSEGNKSYDSARNQIMPVLEGLYKFRHDGKTDGLREYIESMKATCQQK
ncbi:MAG: hypothetical protein RMM17_05150 [Acidobacteriota bacterium]|nr:hypothetical protein [Blastocatellia bacterium]MDW8412052.1 hypothetical protein [Acidobacteriota bacterium]